MRVRNAKGEEYEVIRYTGNNDKEVLSFMAECAKPHWKDPLEEGSWLLKSHFSPKAGVVHPTVMRIKSDVFDKNFTLIDMDMSVFSKGCNNCGTSVGCDDKMVCKGCYDDLSHLFHSMCEQNSSLIKRNKDLEGSHTFVEGRLTTLQAKYAELCEDYRELTRIENSQRVELSKLHDKIPPITNNGVPPIGEVYNHLIELTESLVTHKAHRVSYNGTTAVKEADVLAIYVTEENEEIANHIIHRDTDCEQDIKPGFWFIIEGDKWASTNNSTYFHQFYHLLTPDSKGFPEPGLQLDKVVESFKPEVLKVEDLVLEPSVPKVKSSMTISGETMRDIYGGVVVATVYKKTRNGTLDYDKPFRAIRVMGLNYEKACEIVKKCCPTCHVKPAKFSWFVWDENGWFQTIFTHKDFHGRYHIEDN
jgi:hypothetical protein